MLNWKSPKLAYQVKGYIINSFSPIDFEKGPVIFSEDPIELVKIFSAGLPDGEAGTGVF